MRRLLLIARVVSVLLIVVPLKAYSNTTVCSLCIVEVQTQGINSTAEDYIVIANNTDSSYNLSGIIIKYWTSGGTANSKTIALSGSLQAYNSLSFVSDSLKAANPNLGSLPSGLALADQGGTLRLIQGSLVLDEVSWGKITDPTFNGTVASAHAKGASLVRKQDSSYLYQDSGNNASDFGASMHACTGLSLNEIQPFLIDGNGDDIVPVVEVVKSTQSVVDIDCPIVINSSVFGLAAGDLQSNSSIVVINNVINELSQVVPLPLNSDFANVIQLMPNSLFGNINLPITSTLVTQPILSTDQTYSKFSSGWKTTYAPTLGSANKLLTTPQSQSDDTYTVPPDACSDVLIDEVLPNPAGEDAGNEWLEMTTTTDQPAFLGYCGVVANGTEYRFSQDEFLSSSEFGIFTNFSERIISLKNTGVSTISWGRFDSSSIFTALQTFQYQDAPEGQSWARFDDGWRWLVNPTPGLDNNSQSSVSSTPQITEFPSNLNSTQNQPTNPTNFSSSTVIINELLPNPAAPETDKTDEYIELYNPSSEAIDLSGYKVQTGSNYSYSYTIQGKSIQPGGYLILTSGDTTLSLANANGQAHLIDSNGAVISTTDAYTDAPEGQAWAYIDSKWQWTASPTSGASNIFTKPSVLAGTTSAKKSTKSTKSTKATKPKAASTKKPKATKAAGGSIASTNTNLPGPLHPAVLAGVSALAVGYAAYEYRHDLANRLHQLRRYRKARRASGQPASG